MSGKGESPCTGEDCNVADLVKAISEGVKTIAKGFNDTNNLQQQRLEQGVEITHLHRQNERQDEINKQIFQDYKDLMARLLDIVKDMGTKIDIGQLTGAMKEMKINMVRTITISLAVATVVFGGISLIVQIFFAMKMMASGG